MNGYELSRSWFDFCFENPEKIKPNHTAVFFFAVELSNRLGWKKKFGFPSAMVMEAAGIKSYNTYIRTLNEIVEWGFVRMIERSKNQYSANIIALSKNDKGSDKALDKAIITHEAKQDESNDSIDKQITNNNKPKTKERVKNIRFSTPTQVEVYEFMINKKIQPSLAKIESEKFVNYYESNGWMVGKNKMEKWNSAASNWLIKMNNHFGNTKNRKSTIGNSEAIRNKMKKYD
ncbi:hypothetical protein ATE92_1748 [Ulvibacter sp. MAR_2010_11]|uniref:hypothetical protein n=1 Tax=Ulvibacter sp. MAR_2010_11 TaxID=1250229 RepID=UPI000C2C8761|nr:hypothetical protein [Ulvibacter sp. MAR_2010_11]PKA83591.1 hypothetical protein ATE92_1748 [Ulvibacter sp. MAR_2010_11]